MGFLHPHVAWIHENDHKNTIIILVAVHGDHLHHSKLEIYLEQVNSISSPI